MEDKNKKQITKQIRVYGIVQGVGFRPTVSRHAMAWKVHGNVSNKGPYVEIFAQGTQEAVDGFISDIENKPPKRAAILKMNLEEVRILRCISNLTLSKVKKQKGRFLFLRILPSVMNVKKKCLLHLIADTFILLLTVPAVDQGLPFWMHCHMTENGPV